MYPHFQPFLDNFGRFGVFWVLILRSTISGEPTAKKAWLRYQTVAHSYIKLLWKFHQNPWSAPNFVQLSQVPWVQIGEPRHLSNDSKNKKCDFDFFCSLCSEVKLTVKNKIRLLPLNFFEFNGVIIFILTNQKVCQKKCQRFHKLWRKMSYLGP